MGPCVSTAFAAKSLPLPGVSTAAVAKTLPLPGVSTAAVAKTLPLPCGLPGSAVDYGNWFPEEPNNSGVCSTPAWLG